MDFSVCMCVYGEDNALYFREALESVLDQSLPPAQVVLVIDGPIGVDLQSEVNNFSGKCLLLSVELNIISIKNNVGHGEARQAGIEGAKHHLVALADADDINVYTRFERQMDTFIGNDKLSVVGGQILEILHDTQREVAIRRVPSSCQSIKKYLKSRCPFNQMSVMFKRDDVLKAGGYLDFYHNEDYYLWVRMYLEGFEFFNISEVLVKARVNEKFYKRRGGWKYFLSEARIQKFMYENNIISFLRLVLNLLIRLIVQVLMPPRLRGGFFRLFFRGKA